MAPTPHLSLVDSLILPKSTQEIVPSTLIPGGNMRPLLTVFTPYNLKPYQITRKEEISPRNRIAHDKRSFCIGLRHAFIDFTHAFLKLGPLLYPLLANWHYSLQALSKKTFSGLAIVLLATLCSELGENGSDDEGPNGRKALPKCKLESMLKRLSFMWKNTWSVWVRFLQIFRDEE